MSDPARKGENEPETADFATHTSAGVFTRSLGVYEITGSADISRAVSEYDQQVCERMAEVAHDARRRASNYFPAPLSPAAPELP